MKIPKPKKSAVPEYIWYISLIIIAITLVVGVANITKKANKNIEPPSNINVKFDVYIDPNNRVILKELEFIGQWDLEKDTPFLFLKCGNTLINSVNLSVIANVSKITDLFARKSNGEIGLINYNGIILSNGSKNNSCFQKGAVWELWYGNPNEGGVLLAQDKVDRKWIS